jgi:hypothetical protein
MVLMPLLGDAATTSWPALAQNGDGLRADQAGATDDDDFHGLPILVDDWRLFNLNVSVAETNALVSTRFAARD